MQDGSDAQLLAKAAKAADEASHYEPRLHNKWLPLCPSHLHARSIPETDLLWQCQLQRSKAKTELRAFGSKYWGALFPLGFRRPPRVKD